MTRRVSYDLRGDRMQWVTSPDA